MSHFSDIRSISVNPTKYVGMNFTLVKSTPFYYCIEYENGDRYNAWFDADGRCVHQLIDNVTK